MSGSKLWTFLIATVLGASAGGGAGSAVAQPAATDFPSRTLRILVGFAPGGGTDITARIVAKRLAEQIRQQVVVENRAGGGGVVAMELLAAAAPDGYTFLLGTDSTHASSTHMMSASGALYTVT